LTVANFLQRARTSFSLQFLVQ